MCVTLAYMTHHRWWSCWNRKLWIQAVSKQRKLVSPSLGPLQPLSGLVCWFGESRWASGNLYLLNMATIQWFTDYIKQLIFHCYVCSPGLRGWHPIPATKVETLIPEGRIPLKKNIRVPVQSWPFVKLHRKRCVAIVNGKMIMKTNMSRDVPLKFQRKKTEKNRQCVSSLFGDIVTSFPKAKFHASCHFRAPESRTEDLWVELWKIEGSFPNIIFPAHPDWGYPQPPMFPSSS